MFEPVMCCTCRRKVDESDLPLAVCTKCREIGPVDPDLHRPFVKFYTVSYVSSLADQRVSFIRLRGNWLAELGFVVGGRFKLWVEPPGRLVLEAMEA
jgi:hypothetical protein